MDTSNNQSQAHDDKQSAGASALHFGTAFKYPFNTFSRIFNALWGLLPIIGGFLTFGYGIRITQGFIRGEFEGLPKFQFIDNLKVGFFMFLKSIPFILVNVIVFISLQFVVSFLIADHVGLSGLVMTVLYITLFIFIYPMLWMHFFKHETVGSLFQFSVVKAVFAHLGDYIVCIVKQVFLSVVFLIMSLILIGIPAYQFTQGIFLADFYRRRITTTR